MTTATGPGPCPICGAETSLKTNKTLGIPFYGCTRFPRCKGSRDYGLDPAKAVINTEAQGENMSIMKNMNNMMMDRFFKKVDGVVWDLMTGKIGIMNRDGIATLEGEGDDAAISQNLIDQFGMPLPAFAQSTPVEAVKKGDLIYVNGKPKGWVVEVVEKVTSKGEDGKPDIVNRKFRVLNPDGNNNLWTPPKIQMLGFESGVMVLKSLVEITGGNEGLNGMQGMLMPMMMMGGDMEDMDQLMPMLLMSQTGAFGGAGAGAAAGANNMLQTMMLMKMMGGKGKGKGNNPLTNFFGED